MATTQLHKALCTKCAAQQRPRVNKVREVESLRERSCFRGAHCEAEAACPSSSRNPTALPQVQRGGGVRWEEGYLVPGSTIHPLPGHVAANRRKERRKAQSDRGNAPTFCPDQGGISHPDSGGTLVEASSTVVSPPFDELGGTPQEGREEAWRGHRRRRQAVRPHNHAHRAGEGREAPACCCVTRIAQLVPPATALVQL